MENNSQENVIEPIDTAIDIPLEMEDDIINSLSSETKDDNINSLLLETKNDNINSLSSETKDDILGRTKQHRESIDEIIVPQYIQYMDDDQYIEDNYAVTYSEKDNSLLGWTINIEQNGQQHPDLYFKLDKSYNIDSFKLCKKTLLFCYKVNYCYRKYLFDTKI